MQLLFDQNISHKIVDLVSDIFSNAQQVRHLGLENITDKQIWKYAKSNNYAIVTFDSDFFDFANLFGCPPKIIWIRTGNKQTKHLANFIISKADLINEFLEDSKYREIACLELRDSSLN